MFSIPKLNIFVPRYNKQFGLKLNLKSFLEYSSSRSNFFLKISPDRSLTMSIFMLNKIGQMIQIHKIQASCQSSNLIAKIKYSQPIL